MSTCRICGCTDDHACPEGCTWVEETLCSSCADKAVDGPVEEPAKVLRCAACGTAGRMLVNPGGKALPPTGWGLVEAHGRDPATGYHRIGLVPFCSRECVEKIAPEVTRAIMDDLARPAPWSSGIIVVQG